MKKLLRKCRNLTKKQQIVFLFLFLLVALLPLAIFNFMGDSTYQENAVWYYVLIGFAVIAIAVIAYDQVGNVSEDLRIERLLKIDERWSSPEIVTARRVIHRFYIEARHTLKKEPTNSNDIKSLRELIGHKIINARNSNQDDFMSLLNYLDFMETVSYLENKNYLTLEQLHELFGSTLVFNYEIFKSYIEDRRQRHKNPEFYSKFERLYEKLKKKYHTTD